MSLNAISIVPTAGKVPQSLLIMLHGWGANAKDLAPLASMLSLGDCQLIFPNAPFPHPEVPGGRAWYVLETLDCQGLSESQNLLQNWLFSLENQTGVPLSRTVLAGFSQGGAMSLDVGLQLPLAGICSLSGYLHFQPQTTPFPCSPILIVHGIQDMVVPIQAARKAKDALTDIGAMVEYHEFNGGHEISSITLAILQQFIQKKC
ncbi:MAG: alpha/beta hydrolase [cyanobacterium endosymbiont of Rhopalodia musculus]|uniref:alpha/beta hydrolase n=1 Tax=cyanobacterium endosymbiont of Epithemia clementina EcSB TaxID=3034674 RepID=UPI00247FEEA6|nr:alpha/beta hydrolase [cyanobacterium endosymbiont of Epithemia clementina EcSB]WGT67184.1 alpha/beta hydrolase [cyanobacterium endosymbiont of Epithemia clementina EcSB]